MPHIRYNKFLRFVFCPIYDQMRSNVEHVAVTIQKQSLENMRQERLFDRFAPKYQRIADGRFCYNAAHVRGIILPVSVECPGIDHVVTKRFLLPTVRILRHIRKERVITLPVKFRICLAVSERI